MKEGKGKTSEPNKVTWTHAKIISGISAEACCSERAGKAVLLVVRWGRLAHWSGRWSRFSKNSSCCFSFFSHALGLSLFSTHLLLRELHWKNDLGKVLYFTTHQIMFFSLSCPLPASSQRARPQFNRLSRWPSEQRGTRVQSVLAARCRRCGRVAGRVSPPTRRAAAGVGGDVRDAPQGGAIAPQQPRCPGRAVCPRCAALPETRFNPESLKPV